MRFSAWFLLFCLFSGLPVSEAKPKKSEISFQFRSLAAGVGGFSLWGARYRTNHWEFTLQSMAGILTGGPAYQIYLKEKGWPQLHFNFGLFFPGLLVTGMGMHFGLFKIFGSEMSFRLDNYIYWFPSAAQGHLMIPLLGIGLSFAF